MSIYNVMFGLNPISIWAVPILFKKHPDELPRFRNAWVIKEGDKCVIKILARIGKKYHGKDYNEEFYFNHPQFLRFEDKLHASYEGKDFTDDTYGNYFFDTPLEFKEDLEKVMGSKPEETTSEYQELLIKTYPKLEMFLYIMFNSKKDGEV